MREFFKGWRRKAGCIVLEVACFVALLWVRSLTTADYFKFTIGDRQHRLSSTRDYGLAWENCSLGYHSRYGVFGPQNVVSPGDEIPVVRDAPHLPVLILLLMLSAVLIFPYKRKPRKKATESPPQR